MKYFFTRRRFIRHLPMYPFIYGAALFIIILDIWIELYHRIAFPLYGLKYVRRKDYIKIDRHKLSYLHAFQKVKRLFMIQKTFLLLLLFFHFSGNSIFSQQLSYSIVDTNVKEFYNDESLIFEPLDSDAFFGQDANYSGNQPSYTDNGDSTITDNITELMWQKYMGEKISYDEAFIKAENLSTGGHNDWRVPTIKDLYSLILFDGQVGGQDAIKFFIDTVYFDQPLGDVSIGEREIDAQTWSSTQYVGLTMRGDSTVFGVNFIDGRIKGYPKYDPRNNSLSKTMYFRMVRGNPDYGINSFVDNLDGCISDLATGLMWQQSDDGIFRN